MSDRFEYAVLAPKALPSIIRALFGGEQIRPILVVIPPTKGPHRGNDH